MRVCPINMLLAAGTGRVGRQLNIIFKALRNMDRNSSMGYRQLLSGERLFEVRAVL